MVQRCDLCGARLRAEEAACRECGTPHAPIAGSEDAPNKPAAPPKEVARVAAIPLPVAEDVTQLADISAPGPVPLTEAPPEASAADPVPPPGVEDTPSASPSLPEPSAPEPSVSVGVPAPAVELAVDEPVARSRTGLWVGAAVIVIGAAGAGVALTSASESDASAPTEDNAADEGEADPPPAQSTPPVAEGCDDLTPLAGQWSVASEVTGAASAKKLGIRGYYQLDIVVADCVATATLSKTGFTGKVFADKHVQHGTAVLERGPGALSFGHGSRFSLRDSRNKGVDQEFIFTVSQGELRGVWRQRGKVWTKSGLSGVLTGAREGDARELAPKVSQLSCGGRCVFACDALASQVADDDLNACVTACEAAPAAAAACGSRLPVAAELQLTLNGPQPTLEALCSGFSCDLDPKLDRRRTPNVKGNAGAIHRAHYVHGSREGGGSIRIALETDAGWFLSAALAPTVGTNLAKEITGVTIAATGLGSGEPASVITGHFARRGKALMFACRASTDGPTCIVARGLERARNASVLPEGTIALRTPGPLSDAAAHGALYAW